MHKSRDGMTMSHSLVCSFSKFWVMLAFGGVLGGERGKLREVCLINRNALTFSSPQTVPFGTLVMKSYNCLIDCLHGARSNNGQKDEDTLLLKFRHCIYCFLRFSVVKGGRSDALSREMDQCGRNPSIK